MDYLGKTPPHSIETEQSLLGTLILDKDAITDVIETVSREDFYKEAHKEIYNAIMELYNKNEPVDIITLTETLTKKGTINDLGGIDYISKLTEMGVLTTNAKHYAKIIEEKAVLRRIIKLSSTLMEKGYDSQEASELLAIAEKEVFDISQNQNKEGLEPISSVLHNTFKEIENMYNSDDAITGISTGFIDLDRKTSGFQRSDLVLVAARPSMGKTAFSINICQSAALKVDASVAIFSLEMSREQLVQRMLSTEAQIPLGDIRSGNMKDEDWVSLTKAMASLADARIFIDDTPAITVLEMRAKCRKLKMEKGLDMIMIDYLQLMSGGDKNENRQQEISTISRSLKALAREMKCPVVALSQLSRGPEQRADHRPMLSDLRESGAIEQDADVVMFLYRDEYYNPDTEQKNIGEVIIAKQRNGEVGTIELVWRGEFTKFVDKAYITEPVY